MVFHCTWRSTYDSDLYSIFSHFFLINNHRAAFIDHLLSLYQLNTLCNVHRSFQLNTTLIYITTSSAYSMLIQALLTAVDKSFKLKLNPCTDLGVFVQVYITGLFFMRIDLIRATVEQKHFCTPTIVNIVESLSRRPI